MIKVRDSNENSSRKLLTIDKLKLVSFILYVNSYIKFSAVFKQMTTQKEMCCLFSVNLTLQ